jgi:hypothetical protein
MSLRDTAKGIGVRAAILGAGGLVIGGFLAAAVLKAAGTLVKFLAGVFLLLIGGGLATWKIKKLQRSFAQRDRRNSA